MLLVALLPGAAPTADLTIAIEQLRTDRGELGICVTADPASFPDCKDDARAIWRWTKASAPALTVAGLAHGHYAISVIHDENGNRKLDTFVGIPREGFGFSNNPKIGFGPPKFAAARFSVDGAGTRQQVRMRYML
ncbi:DUF2141 domain-containing protein [Sphingomonas japonica]|uniref:Uncharacterized protein (DUF2141 family) n=1 Tax=Sphingomonas japonica TaxID=511662 RepID=A0ABX0U143_9SPHN|nr:DUF2141 domain-containing protein [Sphingomonas japonica]NIJ23389.1 uncharacterized protein (DUF2141 family) [Sphingomonas japonica]